MESKFSHLPDIESIQPERLIKVRVSEDRCAAEVLVPGLSYNDFDQKIGGKISLWSLGKLLEGIRWQGLRNGLFFYPEFCHGTNRALFVASQSFTMSEDIHKLRYTKYVGIKKPMRALMHVSHVGNSSYSMTVNLFDYHTGLKLCSYLTVVVLIDKTTRSPVQLPREVFLNVDKHLNSVNKQTIKRAEKPTIPLNSFVYNIKVLHSDSDMNHHANQATYVRWCSDAAVVAARRGKLPSFRRHIELYPVRSTELHHLGEALVNDVVAVYVWEEEREPRTLQFCIQLKGRTIFVLKMNFHEGEPVKVAPHLESKL